MSNWEKYIKDEPEHRHHKPKRNKNYFCKRNKLGNNRYGPHVYPDNDNICKLCGHIDKRENNEGNGAYHG